MKKILTSIIFVVAFASYGLYQFVGGANAAAQTTPRTTTSAQTTDVPSNSVSVVSPPKVNTPITSAPPPVVKQKGQYTDGTYTGGTADAYYGNIQVKVAVVGGKISDITFLQYPNDRNESVRINNRAMPVLRSEALQAQSAKVSTVSGASDTSAAFRESLASALSQATS